MGFKTKVQVIQRSSKTRQFYIICPAPLAEAMELEKGECVEWVVVDKCHLTLKRKRSDLKSGRAKTK